MTLKRIHLLVYSTLLVITLASVFLFMKKPVKGDSSSLISVIIPVYNAEKYLNKCLDSVVNQTYKNLEIICVNDGSKDNSLQILNDYKNKDSRIKVIDKPNGGVSSARNAGLDVAAGEYISFVDSDDYIDLDMYRKVLPQLEDYNILTFGYIQEPANSVQFYKKGIFNTYDLLDLPHPLGLVWNSIYKRSFLNENNLRFVSGIFYGEDALFVQMCFLAKNDKIKMIDYNPYHYLFLGENNKYPIEKKIKSALGRFKHLTEFCAQRKMTDKYDWALSSMINLVYNRIMESNDLSERKLYAKDAIDIINSNKEFEQTVENVSGETLNQINSFKSMI